MKVEKKRRIGERTNKVGTKGGKKVALKGVIKKRRTSTRGSSTKPDKMAILERISQRGWGEGHRKEGATFEGRGVWGQGCW